jgi:hypothetical protein
MITNKAVQGSGKEQPPAAPSSFMRMKLRLRAWNAMKSPANTRLSPEYAHTEMKTPTWVEVA